MKLNLLVLIILLYVLFLKLSILKIQVIFRPIALCNVIYTIVAKFLAKMLKNIMPYVMGSSHSDFVAIRILTNNATIVSKNFHYMKNLKGKNGVVC